MKRILFVLLFILSSITIFSQNYLTDFESGLDAQNAAEMMGRYKKLDPYFDEAYSLFPQIPRGVLEAVSFTYTRFTPLAPPKDVADSAEIPATYGPMGLTIDGRGVFRNNAIAVSNYSGLALSEIVTSPRENILAYAAAYSHLQSQMKIDSHDILYHFPILEELSELPMQEDDVLLFARKSYLYSICQFLANPYFREACSIKVPIPNLDNCFGRWLPLLQSEMVQIDGSDSQEPLRNNVDYDGALWNPAGSCNYSSGRNGHSISAVTIHYTAGTYSGAIAWFRNCTYNGVGSKVSAHYVLRSFDGQVTQMVREADKAWHVGNSNYYTVGLEHEAYGDISSYFTTEMYRSSARLTRDICDRNDISPLRMFYRDTLDDGTVLNQGLHSLGSESACVKIKGHQHFPNQTHTDPGPHWNWNYYFKLVNEDTPVTTYQSATGEFTDTGGSDAEYANDERTLTLIQVPNADSITLSFSEFELEPNYDFMWIYDGNSVYAPLIGRWNTHSPLTVTSSGNALLIEFRSDCATTAAGWVARWQAHLPTVNQVPSTEIGWDESQWITENVSIAFVDTDDRQIAHRFYQVMGNDGIRWSANNNCGFACDNFDDLNHSLWSVVEGQWGLNNHKLQSAETERALISMPLAQIIGNTVLYDFYMAFSSTPNEESQAGIQLHFGEGDERLTTYTIVAVPAERRIRIFDVSNGSSSLLASFDNVSINTGTSYLYRILHNMQTGKFMIFRSGVLLGECNSGNRINTTHSRFSFVANRATVQFDNFRVYQSRGEVVELRVGDTTACDARYLAHNGTARAKIKSLVLDDQNKFSSLKEKQLKIDYTPPVLNGNIAFNLDEGENFYQAGVFDAYWNSATDPNSGIAAYEYGMSPTPSDAFVTWIGTTSRTSVPVSFPRLAYRQNYLAVRARNDAGLVSPSLFSNATTNNVGRINPRERVAVSNGKSLLITREETDEQQGFTENNLESAVSIWPNPARDEINVQVLFQQGLSAKRIRVVDLSGKMLTELLPSDGYNPMKITIADMSAGIYFVQVVLDDGSLRQGRFIKY